MSGRVAHFEIPADDLKRAQSFYQKAFGWQINPMPEMNYTLVGVTPLKDGQITEPGSINCGMLKREAEVQHPVITIQVEEINEVLKNTEELGGKTIQRNMPIRDMGFSAYFKDTEGNIIGLYQASR